MYRLAMEAGDKLFAFLVKLYEKVHFPKFTLFLGKLLTKKRRIPLYNLLYRKICSASETYPTRDYGQANNNRITALRYEAEFKLHRKGFTGNYPFFQKDSIQVFAAEEHPFTVMESDDFYFRIQYMVSRSSCPDSGFNSGFFHSRNNESMITKDLSDID